MKRKIIHIDIDAFYASVEQKQNKNFHQKPIIVGTLHERSVVSTCSYEARLYGVRSAMSIVKAQKLCPHADIIYPNMQLYRDISAELESIFLKYTDYVEMVSVDEAYLDVTKNKLNLNSAYLIAQKIKKDINDQLNLSISVGISYNKLLAKIGSEYKKPNGMTIIHENEAQKFIDNLEIEKIHGLGPKNIEKIKKLNIYYGRDFKKYSEEQLVDILGNKNLKEMINEINEEPITSKELRKSISQEVTFENDTLSYEIINKNVVELIKSIIKSLNKYNQLAENISIKIKYHNFKQISRGMKLDNPTNKFEDFYNIYQYFMKEEKLTKNKIRLIGVCAGSLKKKDEVRQINIF